MRIAPGFWERRGAMFSASMRQQADPFLPFLEPWLRPDRTLIDAGAGYGRHAVPLAARLDWVTAVEPAEAMRAQIPPLENLTVIASSWEDAEVAPADLVICSHVMYGVADPVPFLQKLDACARERAFVYLRDRQQLAVPDELYAFLAGRPRARQPVFRDLYNLLQQLGVQPDVSVLRYPAFIRYQGLDQAVEDCRERVGEVWDDERGRAWLQRNLRAEPDGGLVFDGGEMVSGVAHWQPSTS